MSSHLVKKLLRASRERETAAAERPLTVKRKRLDEDTKAKIINSTAWTAIASAPATPQQIFASRVRQMLAIDQSVSNQSAGADTASKQQLKRIRQENKNAKTTAKAARRAILTNSRSSAAQVPKKQLAKVPTINKKVYAKEKEKARLEKIASMLQKISKKKK